MTQEAVAEALNVSAFHYRRMEVGKSGISIDLLIDVAEYFGTSLDYLVLGKSNPASKMKKDLLEMAQAITDMAERI